VFQRRVEGLVSETGPYQMRSLQHEQRLVDLLNKDAVYMFCTTRWYKSGYVDLKRHLALVPRLVIASMHFQVIGARK
jgi:hypothetical protein